MGITTGRATSDLVASVGAWDFSQPQKAFTFNFDQGLAAEETFPLETLLDLHHMVLDRDRGLALEYTSHAYDDETGQITYMPNRQELIYGNCALRSEIAQWLNDVNDRSDLDADNIILTLGSVQAISLGLNATINPGEAVFVESQSFPYALRYMRMRGADVVPVAMDDDGMDTDDLERRIREALAAGIRPRMVYIVATFSCPTGLTTSLPRRQRILELADEFDLVVLEDGVYNDLRVSGEKIPNLLALDQSDRVMQSHSFSKVIAPGIRIGWMAGAQDAIRGLAAVKQDLGVSQLTARVMAEYMRAGHLPGHIERANAIYRRKRDVAAAAVEHYCAPYVRFTLPEGGFYLWLRLSDEIDWARAASLAAERGVLMRPGEVFMDEVDDPDADRYLRLAYSHVEDTEIERGLQALGSAIHDAVRVPEPANTGARTE